MDKDIEKESDVSRTLLANFEQEDTPAFPGTTNVGDPARGLRMSDSFFVSDTMDEDESIIPPTQELLIPSTPPPEEKSSIREEDSSKLNDTTLSNLDETCFEGQKKDEVKESPVKVQVPEKEKEVIDITSQNDLTQDLLDLDATQELLVHRPDPAQYSREVQDVELAEEDDDWNLRFTDTQTQELISSSKLREMEGSNQMGTINEEPSEITPKETSATPPVDSKENPVSPPKPAEKEGEDDSEDEIAPSQSCLEDYQADTHFTYLERMSQNSALEQTPSHSTPDANSNGKPPPLIRVSENLSAPSPIPLNPTPTVVDISDLPSSPLKPAAEESVSVEKSLEAEVSAVEKDVLEQYSTPEPAKLPETINISADEKDTEEKRIPMETIDLLSSVDQTAEVIDVPEVVKPIEKVVEPIKEVVEPVKEVVEPVKEVAEPIKEVAEPVKEVVEPVKEVVEPIKEAAEIAEEEVEEKKPVEVTNAEHEKITNAYMSKVTAMGDAQPVENSEDIKSDLPDTEPNEPNFRLPLPKGNLSLGRKPRLQRTRKAGQSLPLQAVGEFIGKFEDVSSLNQLFRKTVEEHDFNQENLDTIAALKPGEEMEVFRVTVKNNSLFLTRSFEICLPKLHPDSSVSPHSGSSSSLATVNSNHSSNNTSLPLGELADVSSFSSGKSAASTTTLASQDPPKTSTQNSAPTTSFSKLFKDEEKVEDPEEISPIKAAPAAKGRRGRKPAAAKAAAAAVEKPQPTAKAKRRRGRAPAVKAEEKVVANTTDSEVEQPRPKRKKYQRKEKTVAQEKASSLDEEDIVTEKSEDINTDSNPGYILPGVRVMARWHDGYFYPGVVLRKGAESRWEVQFEDNQVEKMSQENLIKVSILEIGTSVLVQSGNKYYEPGIIRGHFREGYEVELDSGVSERFPRTNVILSSDQAKVLPGYQPSSAQSTSAITLDNLVTGKRKRKSTHSPEPPATSKKPTRTSRRLSKTEPNLDSTDTKEMEVVPEPSTSTASTSTGRGRRRAAATLYKDSGSKDPNLFKDFAFILSTTEKRSPAKSYDSEPCSEDDSLIPFDKEEINSRITPRGGIILHKFEAVQKCKRKYIYLLADTYLRTMKYIQCLTAGIPCVRHHWVYDCCFKKEILTLSSYTLPAGFSIITNQIVEWHGKSSVLEGKKIFLISAPENSFTYTWSPVLTAAKAKIVQKLTATTAKSGVDVIVTNKECPADILKTAKLKKIPIVSSEWVIQSLINGRVLKYDEHPHFRYDYNPV